MPIRIKVLKSELELYLEKIGVAVQILELGVQDYLAGRTENFHRQVHELGAVESELDQIRKDIEQKLYKHMLLPESRGDILSLIEHLDDVANYSERLLVGLKAETPHIPECYHEQYCLMADYTRRCALDLVDAMDRYFTNSRLLNAPIGRVRYFEHEIDLMYESLLTQVFGNKDLDLSSKIHIRYFLESLSRISDISEDVSERLIISSLKREI